MVKARLNATSQKHATCFVARAAAITRARKALISLRREYYCDLAETSLTAIEATDEFDSCVRTSAVFRKSNAERNAT